MSIIKNLNTPQELNWAAVILTRILMMVMVIVPKA